MKKIIKFFTIVLLVLIVLITNPINTYADELSDLLSDFNKKYLTYENISGSDVGSTGYMEKGVNESNQGWIVYVIDKWGNVTDSPYIVGSTGNCDVTELATRYKGITPTATASIDIPKSFYFNSSYAGISRRIKST